MTSDYLQELEPPKRGDHYGNLKKQTRRQPVNGPGRPSKGLKQKNLKLAPETLGMLEDLFTQEKRSRKATHSDVITSMIESYNQHGGGRPVTPKPDPQDRSAGRTHLAQVAINPQLYALISKRIKGTDKTMGAVFEDFANRANKQAELERRVAELEAELQGLQS